jgi:hypothetical protein
MSTKAVLKARAYAVGDFPLPSPCGLDAGVCFCAVSFSFASVASVLASPLLLAFSPESSPPASSSPIASAVAAYVFGVQ